MLKDLSKCPAGISIRLFMRKHKQSDFEKRLQTLINTHYNGDWNRIAAIMGTDENEPRVYKIIRLCENAGVNPDTVFFEIAGKN